MDWLKAAQAEDVGNIVALEHLNVTVPDQTLASAFYLGALGLTRDPYMMIGAENIWVNVGFEQFHLPSKPTAQVVPGYTGLVIASLDALAERLKAAEKKLAGTQFAWARENGHVAVTCPWGNRIRCHAPGPEFGNINLGMPYVEFLAPPGAAAGIARFYQQVLRAPVSVEKTSLGLCARVHIGTHQALIFRETPEQTRPYDGHHVAIYVANVSGPYAYFKEHGLVMEELMRHQFRFKTIVDPETGKPLFELEHEVRSMVNPMYRRELVNRDPTQSIRAYRRGADAFRVGTL